MRQIVRSFDPPICDGCHVTSLGDRQKQKTPSGGLVRTGPMAGVESIKRALCGSAKGNCSTEPIGTSGNRRSLGFCGSRPTARTPCKRPQRTPGAGADSLIQTCYFRRLLIMVSNHLAAISEPTKIATVASAQRGALSITIPGICARSRARQRYFVVKIDAATKTRTPTTIANFPIHLAARSTRCCMNSSSAALRSRALRARLISLSPQPQLDQPAECA
jgi:hypothetical protein